MSNWESPSVIQFPQIKRTLATPEQTVQIAGHVYTITSLKWLKIFWERDTKLHSCAKDLFRVLVSTGHVTILCKDGDVTKESILSVKDGSDEEFEITVRDFVRLTALDPNIEINNHDEYILSKLSVLGIKIGMRTEDISTTETILSNEELDIYMPESIRWILESWEFYVCEVYHEKDAPVWYGEPKIFNTIDISLLDIMLSAMYDAEDSGFSITGISLDITYFENNTTVITVIPAWQVEYVLSNALKRKNPLYKNMSFEKMKQHYFQHEVIKKLRELADDEWME